jgi:hypothetical protein
VPKGGVVFSYNTWFLPELKRFGFKNISKKVFHEQADYTDIKNGPMIFQRD